MYFLLELLTGGPLYRHIRAHGGLSESRVQIYAAELVCAIGALHSQGFVYRDLKVSIVSTIISPPYFPPVFVEYTLANSKENDFFLSNLMKKITIEYFTLNGNKPG